MADIAATSGETRPMTAEERKVIFASSLGTVFEWYDFYLYGALALYIGHAFFNSYPEATRNIFVLLAFAAGFLVRPFGALVFGRLGDLVGRKYTFLVTILIMGLSTFIVGLLPGSATLGIAAPIILLILRMLQGLALGGEYGGAATYVAEHAPNGRRGFYTSWIQTTATGGLFLSLVVILGVQATMSGDAFAEWGWRIPFLVSILLLGISVWIRLKMNESPTFQRMKAEGKGSKAPLSEAFGQWKNAKIALLALLGAVMGQAVVWYCGQFYALFFLQNVLKVDPRDANIMVAVALALGTGGFLFFGWLSDKIGRKPIIMAGLLLAALTYFPLFGFLTSAANPALYNAQQTVRATVTADPATCAFQLKLSGIEKFTSNCDVATAFLANNSVPYDIVPATGGASDVTIKVKDTVIPVSDATGFVKPTFVALRDAGYPLMRAAASVPEPKIAAFIAANPELGLTEEQVKAMKSENQAAAKMIRDKTMKADELAGIETLPVYKVDQGGDFKIFADKSQVNWVQTIAILFVLVIYVTMVYGPIAAMLVEMFPTRIRYTGMSLPYHIGNGWFGGLLPAVVFAISAAQGNIYAGLWYPVVVAVICLIIGVLFLRETKDRDIHAD
ncbi:MFS transporter [Rhizobium sp.]